MTTPTFQDPGVLERPRYFPRQLMTPDDLTLEQQYFRDKQRRHNRLLHGWGVVCGAIVCRLTRPKSNGKGKAIKGRSLPCPQVEDETCLDPWIVTVSPGYILGPCGDEILIDCPIEVDVRKSCVTVASGELCPPAPDPWCNDVTVQRRPGPVYLAVRYKEILTRPVRAHPAGCGCDDTACEYSRIRDGYEICALDECPESHHKEPNRREDCVLEPCPPCPDEPWVVLAKIDVGPNGIIGQPDNYDCRRIVASFANYWCQPTKTEPAHHEQPREEVAYEEIIEKMVELVDITQADFPTPERMAEIPQKEAVELRGVTSSSKLGRKLAEKGFTIRDLAELEEDEFAKFALDGETGRLTQMENQARDVWNKAQVVMDLVRLWEK